MPCLVSHKTSLTIRQRLTLAIACSTTTRVLDELLDLGGAYVRMWALQQEEEAKELERAQDVRLTEPIAAVG
jgi:hypothetical protein